MISSSILCLCPVILGPPGAVDTLLWGAPVRCGTSKTPFVNESLTMFARPYIWSLGAGLGSRGVFRGSNFYVP